MLDSGLVWFRRDLRHFDHAALHAALTEAAKVFCVFILDREILDALPSRRDRRVEFILASLAELDQALRAQGGGLIVVDGWASEAIPRLAQALGVQKVFANRDYEPQALARDATVAERLQGAGIAFEHFKDQVIFECDEILTQAKRPYTVFTPYKKAWLTRLHASDMAPWPCVPRPGQLACPPQAQGIPDLAALGFEPSNFAELALPAGMRGGRKMWEKFQPRLSHYRDERDFPARPGVSYLSTHLRFGTVSIRELVAHAWEHRQAAGAETWLSELIWREFYMQTLWHRPDVVDHDFRSDCARLQWDEGPQADALFTAWAEGRTGYPLVDAAMRQLAHSGYMHNRLRMLAASFLTKDLGIDWRRGERFFAEHLNDYDLAANNGGWQWSASTGCDAQPWFRIFNPITQSKHYDPDGAFIKRYVPELAGFATAHIHSPWLAPLSAQQAARCRVGQDYPAPVVDHAAARERTLARFKASLGNTL